MAGPQIEPTAAPEVTAAAAPPAATATTDEPAPAPEPAETTIDPAPVEAIARAARPWAPKFGSTPATDRHIPAIDRHAATVTPPRTGRFGLLAASVALAACIGAAMGAAGIAGIGHLMAAPPPAPKPMAAAPAARPDAEIKALRDTLAQVRTQVRSLSDTVTALRTNADGAAKGTQAQLAKLTETIDRLEKAQAEPLARLTKMAATVERLERGDATAAAAPEITGSVRAAPASPPARPQAQPQPQEQRLARPVVEGWRLHEVQRGVALVEGRIGLAEVMVGDTLRGVGRVQDIRREDGRWVVVTSRGVILPAR